MILSPVTFLSIAPAHHAGVERATMAHIQGRQRQLQHPIEARPEFRQIGRVEWWRRAVRGHLSAQEATTPECVKPRETGSIQIEGASQQFDAPRSSSAPA